MNRFWLNKLVSFKSNNDLHELYLVLAFHVHFMAIVICDIAWVAVPLEIMAIREMSKSQYILLNIIN